MDTKTKDLRRQKRQARRLAMEALDRAGSRPAVARALGVARSTISHECTSRANTVLEAFFRLFLDLIACPDVTARSVADAVNEAMELRDICEADTETLIERGLWLLPEENRRDAIEDDKSLMGPREHAEALQMHGSACMELAAIQIELLERGRDLHSEFRARRAS